jgi:hypothetical protein
MQSGGQFIGVQLSVLAPGLYIAPPGTEADAELVRIAVFDTEGNLLDKLVYPDSTNTRYPVEGGVLRITPEPNTIVTIGLAVLLLGSAAARRGGQTRRN